MIRGQSNILGRANAGLFIDGIIIEEGNASIPLAALRRVRLFLEGIHTLEYTLFLPSTCPINRDHLNMLTYVGTHCFVIEPVFYWPDQLNALHRDTVEDAVLAKVTDFAANPEARAEVLRIRREVIGLFNQQGTLHLQIGRTYPFQAGLRNTPRNTIRALKAMLDPEGRINPGSLGV